MLFLENYLTVSKSLFWVTFIIHSCIGVGVLDTWQPSSPQPTLKRGIRSLYQVVNSAIKSDSIDKNTFDSGSGKVAVWHS